MWSKGFYLLAKNGMFAFSFLRKLARGVRESIDFLKIILAG